MRTRLPKGQGNPRGCVAPLGPKRVIAKGQSGMHSLHPGPPVALWFPMGYAPIPPFWLGSFNNYYALPNPVLRVIREQAKPGGEPNTRAAPLAHLGRGW